MKFLLVLAIAGAATAQYGGPGYSRRPVVPAPLANDGRVVDTPEISHAKNAHFAAHDAAIRALPLRQYNAQPQEYDDGSYREGKYNNDEGRYSGDNQRYTGDNQRYTGDNQRYTGDNQRYTGDNQRYNQGNENRYNNDDYSEPQTEKRWRGPFAKIEFTSDGKFIKETPEVAHARQQHLAALDHARKTNPSVGYEGEAYGGQYRENEQYRSQPEGRNFNAEGRGYNVNEGRGVEDDGQYRGEGSSAPYRNWQGQGNQLGGRQQGFY